jgi:hypothetical protein
MSISSDECRYCLEEKQLALGIKLTVEDNEQSGSAGCLNVVLALFLFFGGLIFLGVGSLFGPIGIIPGLGMLGLAVAILVSDRKSVMGAGVGALILAVGLIWFILKLVNAAIYSR